MVGVHHFTTVLNLMGIILKSAYVVVLLYVLVLKINSLDKNDNMLILHLRREQQYECIVRVIIFHMSLLKQLINMLSLCIANIFLLRIRTSGLK